MNNTAITKRLKINTLLLMGTLLGFAEQSIAADNNFPKLSQSELVDMVAPVALYPDDLVAVVLPAASYPLQLVQAQRVLNDGGSPDAEWDEAVVAVMNYPEVLEFLNDDLDWTYNLGLAFINQERGVFDAVQDFRAEALAAGNLKSDKYQSVRVDNGGNILIEPRAKDTLYVPYYEPQRVVVRHVTPVYNYYPIARPVYYYPYPASYAFNVGHFYGVGTYFSIGWQYRGLNLSYSTGFGHPYAGRNYAIRYSPRHYYFKPRVRRHVVVNQRHYYKPHPNKRIRHQAKHARTHKKFRRAAPQARGKATHNRVAQRNQLQKPQHRLARNSLKQQQQRKQAKFRDTRREAKNFGRTKVAQNTNGRAVKRQAQIRQAQSRQTKNRQAQNRQTQKQAAINRQSQPLVRKVVNQAKRQQAQQQVKQTHARQKPARQAKQHQARQQVRQQPRQQASQRSSKSNRPGRSARASRASR